MVKRGRRNLIFRLCTLSFSFLDDDFAQVPISQHLPDLFAAVNVSATTRFDFTASVGVIYLSALTICKSYKHHYLGYLGFAKIVSCFSSLLLIFNFSDYFHKHCSLLARQAAEMLVNQNFKKAREFIQNRTLACLRYVRCVIFEYMADHCKQSLVFASHMNPCMYSKIFETQCRSFT
jgi:hypothetical protein